MMLWLVVIKDLVYQERVLHSQFNEHLEFDLQLQGCTANLVAKTLVDNTEINHQKNLATTGYAPLVNQAYSE